MAFRLSVAERGLRTQWDDLIYAMAGGDASIIALIKGIISTESEWNPGAINPADPSYGLMQILLGPGGPFPAVRADDLLDPSTNITLGSTFILDLIRRFGMPGAVAAYNAGSPRLNSAGQYTNSRGDTSVQAYVDSVITYQTWFLNAMADQAASGGWVPTSDILRDPYTAPSSSPIVDAVLDVTAWLYGPTDAPYPDVFNPETGAMEPTASPSVLVGSGVAMALLIGGALWWATRR